MKYIEKYNVLFLNVCKRNMYLMQEIAKKETTKYIKK